MILARRGDMAVAQTMCERAYAHAEDREALGLNLAIADCAQGKAIEAQAALRTVLRFNPASLRAREKLESITAHGCSL